MRPVDAHHLAGVDGFLRPGLNGAALRDRPTLEGTFLTAKHPDKILFSAPVVAES
jgi:hypothetical protein